MKLIVVRVLADERHGAGHFAARGEALKDAEQDEEGRSRPADHRRGGDQADTRRGAGDQEQQDGQEVLAAQLVAQEAADHAAKGAGEEADQEADVGQQQGSEVLGPHDVDGQVRGQQAVNAVVVPFHEGAHGAGDGRLAHHLAVSGDNLDLCGIQFH